MIRNRFFNWYILFSNLTKAKVIKYVSEKMFFYNFYLKTTLLQVYNFSILNSFLNSAKILKSTQ
jgi:hypothetical protein